MRCWSLETGRVTKLYHGHERTVTCLAVFLDLIAAGGSDNLCLGKLTIAIIFIVWLTVN